MSEHIRLLVNDNNENPRQLSESQLPCKHFNNESADGRIGDL